MLSAFTNLLTYILTGQARACPGTLCTPGRRRGQVPIPAQLAQRRLGIESESVEAEQLDGHGRLRFRRPAEHGRPRRVRVDSKLKPG